jgi:hypothetical protein
MVDHDQPLISAGRDLVCNQLTIIGFTGQDADLYYTPNGRDHVLGGNERVLEG